MTGAKFMLGVVALVVASAASANADCPVAEGEVQRRTELGTASLTGASSVLRFAQISDVHILDDDGALVAGLSPLDATVSKVATAQRMQDDYTDEVLNSMMASINACSAPGNRIDFMMSTGDNTDLGVVNEVRRFIDNIDGTFDGPTAYEKKCRAELPLLTAPQVADQLCKVPTGKGVADTQTVDPDPNDPTYQLTQVRAVRQALDTLGAVISGRDGNGGTDPSRQTFNRAPGLPAPLRCNAGTAGCMHVGLSADIPWYVAFGNHDGTARGTVPYQPGFQAGATAIGRHYMQLQHEFIDEFFKTTKSPVGHGFAAAGARLNDADQRNDGYYAIDWAKRGVKFRLIVLNTLIDGIEGSVDLGTLPVLGPLQIRNPFALDTGAIDAAQFAWLKGELAAAKAAHRIVLVFSHHPDLSFAEFGQFGFAVPGHTTAAELDAELASYPNVIAWIAGHTHRNRIRAFKVMNGVGTNGTVTTPVACKSASCTGFWEIETSSLIDTPQEARLFEIFVTPGKKNGYISSTLIGHAFTRSRTLADADDRCQFYLDDTAAVQRLVTEADISAICSHDEKRQGEPTDRNVELVFTMP